MREEDQQKRFNLRSAWVEFGQLLDRIEIRNKKVYDDLYKETIKNLEDF